MNLLRHFLLDNHITLQHFQSQQPNPASVTAMPQPPGIRPRVRARRGQATDPHSIAERVTMLFLIIVNPINAMCLYISHKISMHVVAS